MPRDLELLPPAPGSYILELALAEPVAIRPGRLGLVCLGPGRSATTAAPGVPAQRTTFPLKRLAPAPVRQSGRRRVSAETSGPAPVRKTGRRRVSAETSGARPSPAHRTTFPLKRLTRPRSGPPDDGAFPLKRLAPTSVRQTGPHDRKHLARVSVSR
jgi:hypothetical protein